MRALLPAWRRVLVHALGRDAAILVMAKRHAATILTNDKDLAKVAKAMGLNIANPAAR